MTNALVYFDMEAITIVKSFIVLTPSFLQRKVVLEFVQKYFLPLYSILCCNKLAWWSLSVTYTII